MKPINCLSLSSFIVFSIVSVICLKPVVSEAHPHPSKTMQAVHYPSLSNEHLPMIERVFCISQEGAKSICTRAITTPLNDTKTCIINQFTSIKNKLQNIYADSDHRTYWAKDIEQLIAIYQSSLMACAFYKYQ